MSISTGLSSPLGSKLKKREADATSGRLRADDVQILRTGDSATAVES